MRLFLTISKLFLILVEIILTKVCDLLRQYQSVLATSKDDLGETDCVLHK